MNGSLKVFKAHLCDFVKNTFGNGVFELNMKNLIEKHLVYSIAFINFLFKDEALNESIVQYTRSCVKIENQSLGYTSLYSITFKGNEFENECFQRKGKWYDLGYARNCRGIASSGHKNYGRKNGRGAPRKDSHI
ncbi:hypothetical protein M9H77_22785 [Catharanthus roseus]|uniref:Uncharacterized protein n=1 Tax=Catharanthus roseus TaxID=4058 RepID=A0ACC0AR41_CATRO|nr:hypothetical protein M9H77_22785 [Catharanthus roseus]